MHSQVGISLVAAFSVLLQATTVTASFDGNLNYVSPSRRHPSLGIDIPHVARRSLKRGNVAYAPSDLSFTHGVASGDPYSDSIILWTRVAPSSASDASNVTVDGPVPLYNHDTQVYIGADPTPICIDWAVFPEGGLNGSAIASGTAYTTSDIDYTVKVEATGLEPFTTYNYQFTICGSDVTSPVGRTKTAPTADADVSEVNFAVFSCSNYPNGYFNAYGNAARKDNQDYFVHLGDYIYESAARGERAHQPPRLLFTLYDYRTRHGQYRTDPDLQLASQNFAWITTWDDHEVSNNGYRDGSSGLKCANPPLYHLIRQLLISFYLSNTEDSFLKNGGVSVDQRKMNAVRAYFEWMPIRQVDLDDNLRIWRSFQMGNLLDFIVLDTRNYDRSITSLDWNDNYIDLIRDDASRTLMGSRQENWFYRELSKSSDRGAAWRIIGNQIVFSRIYESYGLSGDNWSGYSANRNRTLKHLYDNNIGNNVFLAGDSHQNWVSDLVWLDEKEYDPETGDGSIGVEFAGTAVSSTGQNSPILPARTQAEYRVGNNSELQWQDGYYRGYILLSVKQDSVQAQFYGSPSVATRNSWDLPLANFTVINGENKLARPVAGGSVESGALRGGKTTPTNLTLNTDTGEWDIVGYEQMYIKT
ncbi:alkaline phosphatase-like protein [Xylaria bambusicola]|uniref:alkaline phosphatase-like protein n=1 Tax=Xylaria bambusicola TaxID=326684 RepID=UPI0020077BDC|nr:alkaline phosphatase-like protein [Xylaria bambusicola]KAI0505254.1 alkaline phosphatase-like protein [Xylaria bambusicola]